MTIPSLQQSPPVEGRSPSAAVRAFSLIEILVALALLSFIVIALFVVFNNVQRAFRASMNQTDLFEAGRAVNDTLSREIQQITPSDLNTVNFYAQIVNDRPVVQTLPGNDPLGLRTNLLEDVFMLTRTSEGWTGVGYIVRTNDSAGRLWRAQISPGNPGQAGVGSLYRYSYSLPYLYTNAALGPVGVQLDPSVIYTAFANATVQGSTLISNRVCDGVIHFHLRAYNTNGWRIVSGPSYNTLIQTNSPLVPGDTVWSYAFYSNAVPAFVETELGLLEPRAVTRFFSIGDPTAQLNYLKREDITARVQLFRQRIAVRNVDPTAFQ